MSDQTIFNNENKQAETQSQTITNDNPYADLLKGIKNESGEQKYKSVQDALIGLQNAQNYIQTLKTEKSQTEQEVTNLRAAAEKVSELEHVVLELQKSNQSQSTPATVDENVVRNLVNQAIAQTKQEDISKSNIAKVAEAVKNSFGEKAEEVFYGKAEEVGLSRQAINALAAQSPAAALALLGITQSSGSSTAPVKGTVNTTNLSPNQESLIGRNKVKLEVGASYHELNNEMASAKKMAEELAAKGMSMDDLTKPSNYFKYFNN